jgi:hypothetical protein
LKSILKEIEALKRWDYYERKEEYKLDKVKDWNDENEHKKFIEDFLRISGKDVVLNHFSINLEQLSRKIHTNSVFFLGCLFYEKLNIDDLLNFQREDGNQEFNFIWFLSALIHDFYHDKERKLEEFTEINEDIKSIEVINDLLEYIEKNQLVQENKKIKNLFEVIPNYFKYRFNDGKIDHGIFTGIKLFDSLEKNRKERKEQVANGVENGVLYWGDDLISIYAQASLSITMHNIWSSGKKDEIKEKYRKFGLESLITGETKIFPISIKDNPLLFLLGLVDTIEPIKTFNCVTPQYVLENIMISFNKKQNQITIKNKKNSGLDFEKLKENINGLNEWLDIKIPKNKDIENKIIIEIMNWKK